MTVTVVIVSVDSDNTDVIMVSRRRILSQSRDELSFRARQETEEDDTWYNKDKLYKVNFISDKLYNGKCQLSQPLSN